MTEDDKKTSQNSDSEQESKTTASEEQAADKSATSEASVEIATPTEDASEENKNLEGKAKPNSVEKKPNKQKKAEVKAGKSSVLAWLCLLLCVALACAFAYLYLELQKITAQVDIKVENEIVHLATQAELAAQTESTQQKFAQAQTQYSAQQKKLAELEARARAQQSQLLAMSTTSRNDWLLAEAEYLLKLANQRVLVERKAETAIGLLQEADNILRDLADPDLFDLRAAIKKDLVALKLVEESDIEGVYLDLAALASKIDALPLVPKAYNYNTSAEQDLPESESGAQSSISKFFTGLSDYVRIVSHSERPAAILPPDEASYMQLNLRLMIEQAQLALLREEVSIYQQSISEAEAWVKKYFPSTQQTDQFQQELLRLKQQQIQVELPDIADSLKLLQNYISVLHKLDPRKANSTQAEAG